MIGAVLSIFIAVAVLIIVGFSATIYAYCTVRGGRRRYRAN